MRHHGIFVQDDPYAYDPMTIMDLNIQFTIYLKSMGTTIYIDTWKPTREDLKSFPHIVLFSEEPIRIGRDQDEIFCKVQTIDNTENPLYNHRYNSRNIRA